MFDISALKLNFSDIEPLTIIVYFWLFLLSALFVWTKSRINCAEKNINEMYHRKREASKQMLNLHSEVALRLQMKKDDLLDRFYKMSGDIVVWTSDEVLFEYIKYYKERFGKEIIKEIKDFEIHLGKAILAYRKEFGQKNRRNKIDLKDIALIIRAGGPNVS